jgi:hypothetical protein
MKRCSHCGNIYPNEATVCVTDGTPLKEEPKTHTIHGVYLTVPKVKEIPLSLLIVSYLFLLPAVPNILILIFMGWLVYLGGLPRRGSLIFLTTFGIICAGVLFWFFLSRGIRYCSRGWRFCALAIIWLGFIVGIAQIAEFLIRQKLPHHETTFKFWIGMGLSFPLLIWQYWVLTRSNIRSLFYPEMRKKA